MAYEIAHFQTAGQGELVMTHESLRHGSKVVDTIVIHKADTLPDWWEDRSLADKVKEIRRWHVDQRGWRDIGYHWVIDRDANVAPGRPETEVGAHVGGQNTGKIGICLLGGYGSNSKVNEFSDSFTEGQDAALRKLIQDIKSRARIKRVVGHSDLAPTSCPGFKVSTWLQGAAAPEIVKHHMANSSKATVAKCGQRAIEGTVIAGISYEGMKYGLGEANQIVAMINTLVSQIGWVIIPAGLGAAWAVFGWMRNKQKEDIKEGRYESSVPVEEL